MQTRHLVRWHTLLLGVALAIPAAAEFNPTNWTSTVHYVSKDGGHEAPYIDWGTAATNIEAALAVCQDGEAVCVSNGVYQEDESAWVTNGTLLIAYLGRAATVIDGGYPDRSNRCLVVDHPDAVVEGFTIRNGYATGEGNAWGGGAWLRLGTLKDCVVVSNTAYHFNPTNFSPEGEGGGVYVSDADDAYTNLIADCVVEDNVAGRRGAGVCMEGGRVQDSTIRDNTSPTNFWESYLQGGGVHAAGDAMVRNCTIQSNSAYTGGGVSLAGNATLRDSQVRGNQAEEGGGLEVVDDACQVSACLFSGNSAVYGGGVWMSAGELRSCTVASNTAHYHDTDFDIHFGDGGGVRMYGGNLSGCTILANSAAERGSGVCAEQATLNDCAIAGNSNVWPTVSEGGGLCGVWLVTASHCVISDNEATAGGGVVLGPGPDAWLENSVVCGNRAVEGGGIQANGQGAIATHCTVADNTATDGGGVLQTPEGSLSLVNCIIYNNRATTGSNHLARGGTTIGFSNCCTAPLPPDSGCVAGPPHFATIPDNTYRLTVHSPCVDVGTDDHHIDDDLDRLPRPLDGDGLGGAQFDIGAHEYANPTTDSDGDNRDDASEAACGSNPTRADDTFQVRTVTLGGGKTIVAIWRGGKFRVYTFQSRNDLYGSTWSNVPGCEDMAGGGGDMQTTVSAGKRLEYFRVKSRWGKYQWPSCP